MKNKRIIALALAAGLMLSFCSCSQKTEETEETIQQTAAVTETAQPAQTEEPLAPVIRPREPSIFDEPAIDPDNALNISHLMTVLVNAYESPGEETDAAINEALSNIQSISQADYELAERIVDNWCEVYLDPGYTLNLYQGEDNAPELVGSGIPDSASHAIVILGYELSNGQMQDELVGRLEAAASLAHAYPQAFIVCSGGATGPNNTEGNTEAGLMRDYLVETCGIDSARILADERALTTADNALNTFAMLRDNDVHSITIVTSSYHMRWGQADYNVVAALYANRLGYDIESISNYCYDTEPAYDYYARGDRFAARQICEILGVPTEYISEMPSPF